MDRPPEALFTCPQRPEKKEEKEEREEGLVEQTEDDTDPSQLRLEPIAEGAPKVYPFMLDQIGPDFTMAFFGKRREGKSFAMRWMLYHLRHKIPRIYVFTNTRLNGFWQEFVPEDKIFDGYSAGVMNQIKQNQIKIVTWMMKHPDEGKKINPYVVVVLEDCMSQDLHHMEQLTDLFFNGRHLKILLMISLQYARGIPPGESVVVGWFGVCDSLHTRVHSGVEFLPSSDLWASRPGGLFCCVCP